MSTFIANNIFYLKPCQVRWHSDELARIERDNWGNFGALWNLRSNLARNIENDIRRNLNLEADPNKIIIVQPLTASTSEGKLTDFEFAVITMQRNDPRQDRLVRLSLSAIDRHYNPAQAEVPLVRLAA